MQIGQILKCCKQSSKGSVLMHHDKIVFLKKNTQQEKDATNTLLYFVSASLAPYATLGDVETYSLTIDVAGNYAKTFDSYCVKVMNMQECSTNGTKGTNVLYITGLTAGTNYSFHVYTVWQDVLSEHATTIQSFTSKNLIKCISFLS